MNQTPLGERLQNIEDEISLLDSSLDAKVRELWLALDAINGMVAELRNQCGTGR